MSLLLHLTKPLHVQVTHYEEDDEGVTVHFSDTTLPRRAKLLVGADGYFSKVRSQCLNDGPPDFVVSCNQANNTTRPQHRKENVESMLIIILWSSWGSSQKCTPCLKEQRANNSVDTIGGNPLVGVKDLQSNHIVYAVWL